MYNYSNDKRKPSQGHRVLTTTKTYIQDKSRSI